MKNSEYNIKRNKLRKKNKEAYIIEKTKGLCQACYKSFPVEIFDFHHRNPKDKTMSLCNWKWGAKIVNKKVIDEANKCYILCSNCHRLEHIAMKRGESVVNNKEAYSRYRNHCFTRR
jgi:hypothetical protein|tara:strand:+ start:3680 stop:4030 length:351 start_codon:yes stop_codon:yes gene_type:complete